MSLAVRVIPCLDVDAGRVVKGVNFEGLRDAGDPVELATRYNAEGADELIFLDITASSSGRATMLDVVRRTADAVFIPLTVGVASEGRRLRRVAARRGTRSASTPGDCRSRPADQGGGRFGNQCVVLSVDARRARGTPSGFEITTHGAQGDRHRCGRMGRKWRALGAGEILLNSMDAGGNRGLRR